MQEQQEKDYRVYVTDLFRAVGENTAKLVGGGYIEARWIDMIEQKPQDTRTGEEIVADIIKKAGLKVVK